MATVTRSGMRGRPLARDEDVGVRRARRPERQVASFAGEGRQ